MARRTFGTSLAPDVQRPAVAAAVLGRTAVAVAAVAAALTIPLDPLATAEPGLVAAASGSAAAETAAVQKVYSAHRLWPEQIPAWATQTPRHH